MTYCMYKIMQGVWGANADTAWEFYISDTLPIDTDISAVMGISFWDGKIALTKTKRGWEIPGGHVESGENTHACLARELNEEIGAVNILTKKLFGFRKIINPDRKVYGTEGKQYPRNTLVPYYLVDLGSEPVGAHAEDCFGSGLFNPYDTEIQESHDYALILLGYMLHNSEC